MKHGLRKHPLYSVWLSIRNRCNNKSNPSYKHYGGRGIKVSEEWDDFIAFFKDMVQTYKEGLWLERIDNNGDYSKDNCRWATPSEQSRNKRSNVWLTLNGETKVLKDWAKRLKINNQTLHQRYAVYGWSVERTLTTPLKK